MIRTREEAIKQCEDFIENHSEWSVEVEWANGVEFVLEDYKRFLKQEPRKGHWIKGYTFPDGAYWKCDKCNELIKVKIPMHYCNNCGADMREVEE